MTSNTAASWIRLELRNLMNIAEQALRGGYSRNATKPKASSTRQSDGRVWLPTMTHTTEKDSSLLLPLTRQQPQPPLIILWSNKSPPFSFHPTESKALIFYHWRCHWRQCLFICACYANKLLWCSITCYNLRSVTSSSFPLIYFCWDWQWRFGTKQH